jgi:nickel superoxide dismutase
MARVLKNKRILLGVSISIVILASLAWSHCQIPCGIYGDETRFEMLAEHITTVEKSMRQITELSAQAKPDMNQIVRWVNNKDEHCDEIAHIVTYYFMAQRVKLPDKGDAKAYELYVKKLTLLHEMLVYSMKAKQGTDNANVEKLQSLLTTFHDVYDGKEK